MTKVDLADVFVFLDGVRESGSINMFGVRPYVEKEFGLTRQEASAMVSSWMKTFDGKSTVEERVKKAGGE